MIIIYYDDDDNNINRGKQFFPCFFSLVYSYSSDKNCTEKIEIPKFCSSHFLYSIHSLNVCHCLFFFLLLLLLFLSFAVVCFLLPYIHLFHHHTKHRRKIIQPTNQTNKQNIHIFIIIHSSSSSTESECIYT